MSAETKHDCHKEETDPDQIVQLTDSDGNPVSGIGRLDQVIGAEEADRFFAEREARKSFLYRKAVQRWAPQGSGYGSIRRGPHTA